MDEAAFRNSPCGHLERTIDGAWAFMPDPLPPKIDMARVVGPLIDASTQIGELRGIGRTLPNPYILIRPFQRNEAIASSNIEGTYTSFSDLLLFEAGADERERPPDTAEVYNYVRSLEQSISRLSELPVCLRLIKEAHAILLKGTSKKYRGASVSPGEFRSVQNWIGGSADTVHTARFVPPSPGPSMANALSDLEKYINTSDGLPLLVRLALIHHQFETIHPFPDGNGRVGRLLIPLILSEQKLLPQPLLYLSAYFEKHRDKYIDLMFNVSKTGAWIAWIEFFLEAVVSQCQDTIDRVQRLQDLQKTYRDRLQKARATALMIRLVDAIFETPYVTIPQTQKLLGVTYRAAQQNVEKLVKAGILRDLELPRRPRFFAASEVFDIVHGAAKA